MAKTTEGKCQNCNGIFSKIKMTSHVEVCGKEKDNQDQNKLTKTKNKKDVFHILVQGKYAPDYWINIEIPVGATLDLLDRFLRDIWLECCGHMSAFTIDGKRYSIAPMDEYDEQGMDVRLFEVIEPGMKFEHEYDFGSTTHLVLKVISQYPSDIKSKSVKLLARNEPPAYQCYSCGKPATKICPECIYSDKGLLCNDCASRHKCGEEMLLPVVNSPRTGVCGYTGD